MKYDALNVKESIKIKYRQEACNGKQVFGRWARLLVKDLKVESFRVFRAGRDQQQYSILDAIKFFTF